MNIVSQVAILLQDISGSSESSLIEFSDVSHKAIQALIELCTGNFANQQTVLNAQILDTIHLVLVQQVCFFDHANYIKWKDYTKIHYLTNLEKC